MTKLFIPSITDRLEMTWMFSGLHDLFLLTGHGSLNSYLHRINQSPSSLGHCGGGEENTLHVLFQCPLYEHLRHWSPDVTENSVHLLLTQENYGEFVNFARGAFQVRTEALRSDDV